MTLLRALAMAGMASLPIAAGAQQLKLMADPPIQQACPAGLPAQSRCWLGRDYLGAWHWMALPPGWDARTGTVVLHAHGGPELGDPKAERGAEDLQRWSVWLRAGYAWAGTTYRQGGVELVAAGEDVERLRQTFIAEFGEPQRTLLHGQSWGAGVAARMAERYTTPDFHPRRPSSGKPPYDAVLLTSGVLGGARSYDFRMDLRAVYQAVCNNHPRPDEPAYPLWMGLPLQAKMTRAQLDERLDACTGVRRKPAERTAAQQAALKTLTQVLRIPESALSGHLAWATYHFHDIAWRKLQGRGAFGNDGVRYAGSADDEALNARVPRYRADAAARAALRADIDPTGLIQRPTLTMHGIGDATAFVELESEFRSVVEEAGKLDNLVQVYTADRDHSYSSDAQYVAAAAALLDWAGGGARPTAQTVAERCSALDAVWQPASGCRIRPDFHPAPLDSRVPLRAGDRPASGPPAMGRPSAVEQSVPMR